MKTLFLYTPGGRGVIPLSWKGLNLLVANKPNIGHVQDDLNGNLVETIDMGFRGYGCGPKKDSLFRLGDQITQYVLSGPDEYHLIVADHTPVCEQIVLALNRIRDSFGVKGIIRFCDKYKNPNPPNKNCNPPHVCGYNFDFHKDFSTLYDFLTFPELSQITNGLSLIDAVELFNLKNSGPEELPILPIGKES